MKKYRDIDSGEIITVDQLALEYIDNLKRCPAEYVHISFPEYVANCMTYNGGTLEYYPKQDHTELFKHFRRPSSFDDNGNPIFD